MLKLHYVHKSEFFIFRQKDSIEHHLEQTVEQEREKNRMQSNGNGTEICEKVQDSSSDEEDYFPVRGC